MRFDIWGLLISLPAILIAITIHEFFHAYTAVKMGDRTPEYHGRLSLNPLNHLDLIGTIMLVLVRFGWAKPVPINPNNFKNYKKGIILVSLAGPLSNFILAVVVIMFRRTMMGIGSNYLNLFIDTLIFINIALAIFNLIPIPPLDGSKILFAFIPYKYKYISDFIERYGIILLFGIFYLIYRTGFLYSIVINIVYFLIRISPF